MDAGGGIEIDGGRDSINSCQVGMGISVGDDGGVGDLEAWDGLCGDGVGCGCVGAPGCGLGVCSGVLDGRFGWALSWCWRVGCGCLGAPG